MGKRHKKGKKWNGKRSKEEHVETQGLFYVEKILDWGLHDNGNLMYLLKWENYDESENSWEFEPQVIDCVQLKDQFSDTINGRYPPKYSFEEYYKFIDYLKIVIDVNYKDIAVLRKLSPKKYSSSQFKTTANLEEIKSIIACELDKLLAKKFKSKSNNERLESRQLSAKVAKDLNIQTEFGSITQFFDFVDERHKYLERLKRWEDKQNKIIEEGKEGLPISVCNDVDLEKPKLKYITQYIFDYKLGNGLKIEDETPLVHCECKNCYEERELCCTSVVGFPMVYNNKSLISFQRFSTIIFECNSKCKCGPNCANRSVQRGRQSRLQLFRTDSKIRGWGVRALEHIPKGSFISQYTGEVISLKEAEARPTTYLFDLSTHLDTKDVDFTYVVDASQYGNITRFVNHSCEPNCRVLFAWIESFDKLLPIIALFAIKPIRPFEELTYDYSMELIDIFDENENDSNSESESDSDSDNQSSQSTQITPFGTDVNVTKDDKKESIDKSDENQINGNQLNTQEIQRKVTFNKISCECGSKSCRGFLYS